MANNKPNILYAREFGRRLTARMDELGMTLTELSEATGITKGYICLLMHGDHVPRADMIAKLARALDMATDELINFTV